MNYPELTNDHDPSIHVQPYADMIDKLTYVQKADFAKRALELERDCATYKKMFEEVSRERNAWISEYRAASEEIEKLRRNLGHLMTWIGKEHPEDMLRLMDEMTQQDFINSPQNLNRDTMIIGFRKP